jgi:hypothetical protein
MLRPDGCISLLSPLGSISLNIGVEYDRLGS